MSAIAAVQTAMYARMVADSTLTGLVAVSVKDGGPGIFNDVPKGQTYPHVVMSGAREMPNHTFGSATQGLGWTVRVPIYSMSQSDGDAEALAIHNEIVSLFNFNTQAVMPVTGYSMVSVEYAAELPGRVFVVDLEKVQTRKILAEFKVEVRQ